MNVSVMHDGPQNRIFNTSIVQYEPLVWDCYSFDIRTTHRILQFWEFGHSNHSNHSINALTQSSLKPMRTNIRIIVSISVIKLEMANLSVSLEFSAKWTEKHDNNNTQQRIEHFNRFGRIALYLCMITKIFRFCVCVWHVTVWHIRNFHNSVHYSVR